MVLVNHAVRFAWTGLDSDSVPASLRVPVIYRTVPAVASLLRVS
jgi:hypothetical protein